jgi:plastocyanin
MLSKNALMVSLFVAAVAVTGCSSSSVVDDSGTTTTTTAASASLTTTTTAASATSTTTDSSDGATISVVNFQFNPGSITVSVGESVTWTNNSAGRHTTTAKSGEWNTQLGAGESFTQIFETAGTFDFFCSIHPSMTGTVTVSS